MPHCRRTTFHLCFTFGHPPPLLLSARHSRRLFSPPPRVPVFLSSSSPPMSPCWISLPPCKVIPSRYLSSTVDTTYSPVQLTQMSRSPSVYMKAISIKVPFFHPTIGSKKSLLVYSLPTLVCRLLLQCAAMTLLSSAVHHLRLPLMLRT